MKTLATVLSAALLIASASTPVCAEVTDETLTRMVSYSDLNLDSPQGTAVLYQRLRGAARRVCAPLESRNLEVQLQFQHCYSHAMDSAVTQFNRPQLTALHRQSSTLKG